MTKLVVLKNGGQPARDQSIPLWTARHELRRFLSSALDYDMSTVCEMLKSFCGRMNYQCTERKELLRLDKSFSVIGEKRVFRIRPNLQHTIEVSVFAERGKTDVIISSR